MGPSQGAGGDVPNLRPLEMREPPCTRGPSVATAPPDPCVLGMKASPLGLLPELEWRGNEPGRRRGKHFLCRCCTSQAQNTETVEMQSVLAAHLAVSTRLQRCHPQRLQTGSGAVLGETKPTAGLFSLGARVVLGRGMRLWGWALGGRWCPDSVLKVGSWSSELKS